MAGKKMEGNEQQRRRKACDARAAGRRPSEQGATQGASKQPRHLAGDEQHVEKLASIREGKQPDPGQHVTTPRPRPGSRD